MAWETVKSHTDPDNGIVVQKQRQRRPKHGTEIRYMVTTKSNRIFSFNRNEITDLVDTLNDVFDEIEDGKF